MCFLEVRPIDNAPLFRQDLEREFERRSGAYDSSVLTLEFQRRSNSPTLLLRRKS